MAESNQYGIFHFVVFHFGECAGCLLSAIKTRVVEPFIFHVNFFFIVYEHRAGKCISQA